MNQPPHEDLERNDEFPIIETYSWNSIEETLSINDSSIINNQNIIDTSWNISKLK